MEIKFGHILMFVGVVMLIAQIGSAIFADNQYKNDIQNYWTLADRASTIDAKSDYIDKFVIALDNSGLHGYNAIILKNPENNFDTNLATLKTLQLRLHEIKNMNVSSFEYQQAINQITAQEQGEAKDMLDVFSGTWYLNTHIWLWDWIGAIVFLFEVMMILGGVIINIVEF